MKKFLSLFAVMFSLICLGTVAMAQIADPVITPVSDSDFLSFLLQSLGGIKGASTLAIVGVVVQVLIKFLGTDLFGNLFKNVTGAMKLLIVAVLTLVSGVVGLVGVEGLSISAALLHSTTLTAFLVLGNQIYKQFVVKKD